MGCHGHGRRRQCLQRRESAAGWAVMMVERLCMCNQPLAGHRGRPARALSRPPLGGSPALSHTPPVLLHNADAQSCVRSLDTCL